MVETSVPQTWNEFLRRGGAARIDLPDLVTVDLDAWSAAADRRVLTVEMQDCAGSHDALRAMALAFDVDSDDLDYSEDGDAWDVLDDALEDYDVGPASGLVLVWSGWDGLEEEDDGEELIGTVLDALRTAADTWADQGRPWAILMVGEGRSWTLPWLGAGTPPWEESETTASEGLFSVGPFSDGSSSDSQVDADQGEDGGLDWDAADRLIDDADRWDEQADAGHSVDRKPRTKSHNAL